MSVWAWSQMLAITFIRWGIGWFVGCVELEPAFSNNIHGV